MWKESLDCLTPRAWVLTGHSFQGRQKLLCFAEQEEGSGVGRRKGQWCAEHPSQ